jgi:cytochrome c oxidase subunit 4
MSHSATHAANPSDAHGHDEGHSHAVVGPGILRTILVFLLFFTVLTVATAQLEVYLENVMGLVLPWWVNVAGAMLIATVKSILVMAYFMQLKYDNPINTLAMLFCFFALGLFLMFTGLDLFSRGMIYDFKAGPVIAGGTGSGVLGANNQPVVTASKVRFKEALAENYTKEWLICADAVSIAAHEAAELETPEGDAAAKVLTAKANEMMDLHVIKLHPPHGPSQAATAKEVEDLAAKLAGSNAAASAIVVAAAKSVASLDMEKAKASYSVDGMFEKLAIVAHGGHHAAHGGPASTGNSSRAHTGLSGALSTEHGHGAAKHGAGAHAAPAAGH